MKVPRFRIAWLMVLVAIAALNFGAIRVFSYYTYFYPLVCAGSLPMANVLVAGLLIGCRHRENRQFLLGFEAFGATALAVYLALAIRFPRELFLTYFELAATPCRTVIGYFLRAGDMPISVVVWAVMLVLPQAIFALIGGFLFRKFKLAE